MQAGNAAEAGRIAIVVPLREGTRSEAERLLGEGPPFDPERVGLERHEVFLTDQEAIFVFDAASAGSLQTLLADSEVWTTSAAAWHGVVAGPPRMATAAFAWATVPGSDDLFFDATPGPGDSEGGDVYSP